MQQQTRLQDLLERLMAHTATEEELNELAGLVGEDAPGAPIDEIEAASEEEYARFSKDYDRERWMKVADRILAADLNATGKRRVTSIRRYYRQAVAAAVLCAIALTAYLWMQRSSAPALVSAPATRDVPPGAARALLTLGDGSTVALDSVGNRVIRQGNTAVYQQGGQLQYNAREQHEAAVSYNTLSTPRGGRYQVLLPDGSRVWLNAASSLRYPTAFSDTARVVELSGEAYFEVRALSRSSSANGAGSRVPFRVKTNNMTVQVLGTEFNVHAYTDESQATTTLVNGKVQVSSRHSTLLLQPGQQARLHGPGQLSLLPEADVEQAIAWKNGFFRFVKADIHTIMQQLSRWYDVDVQYSPDLRPYSFSAVISRNNNISQVLAMLEGTGEIHFRVEGRQVFVTP